MVIYRVAPQNVNRFRIKVKSRWRI